MRWYPYILSFYILALACLPCNDAEAGMLHGTVSIEAADDHADHTHEQDQCSPLCICACCSTQATQLKAVTLTHFAEQESTCYAAACTNPLRTFQRAIWQPPRVS